MKTYYTVLWHREVNVMAMHRLDADGESWITFMDAIFDRFILRDHILVPMTEIRSFDLDSLVFDYHWHVIGEI